MLVQRALYAKTQAIRESLSSLSGSLPSGYTPYGLNQDTPIDVVMGQSMADCNSTDNIQRSAGFKKKRKEKKESTQAALINNWGFVFIVGSELGLVGWGVRVKAWSFCCMLCLLTDKHWLFLVSKEKETLPQKLPLS